MLQYFGVDIALLGTEAFTYRRFGVLLKSLPRESRLSRALNGPAAEWGDSEHLLASIVDELRILCYTYVSAHIPKNKTRPHKPKMVKRPGAAVEKKQVRMSLAEMRKQLQRPDWVDVGAEPVGAE